jgi:hypothetical protein
MRRQETRAGLGPRGQVVRRWLVQSLAVRGAVARSARLPRPRPLQTSAVLTAASPPRRSGAARRAPGTRRRRRGRGQGSQEGRDWCQGGQGGQHLLGWVLVIIIGCVARSAVRDCTVLMYHVPLCKRIHSNSARHLYHSAPAVICTGLTPLCAARRRHSPALGVIAISVVVEG